MLAAEAAPFPFEVLPVRKPAPRVARLNGVEEIRMLDDEASEVRAATCQRQNRIGPVQIGGKGACRRETLQRAHRFGGIRKAIQPRRQEGGRSAGRCAERNSAAPTTVTPRSSASGGPARAAPRGVARAMTRTGF